MAPSPPNEAIKEKSSSLMKLMLAFGLVSVILACLFFWWADNFAGNWSYLTQAPPDTKQIIAGAQGVVYIQDQSGQVYSCYPHFEEECWIPDALPDDLPKFQPCNKRQLAFVFFSKPPEDIISCIQYDEPVQETGFFFILALKNNGEVWRWEHSSTVYLLFALPFVILVAGLLGMILGEIIWVGYRLVNSVTRKKRISTKQLVLLVIPWVFLMSIIAVYVYLFYPSRSKIPPEQLAEYTAMEGTLDAELTAEATQISAQLPRGTQSPGYDLIALSCQAKWQVGFDEITCPDITLHKKSPFIVNPGDYALKGGTLTASALVMPVGSEAHIMEAVFPRMEIQNNDHFRSMVGCLDMGDACDVYFELSYLTDSGGTITLGRVKPPNDGDPSDIDLDLSHLAGKTVNIRLYVYTSRNVKNQYPLWVNPTIGP